MDTIESLKIEIQALKKIIDLYNISTKLDYEKILKLVDRLNELQKK